MTTNTNIQATSPNNSNTIINPNIDLCRSVTTNDDNDGSTAATNLLLRFFSVKQHNSKRRGRQIGSWLSRLLLLRHSAYASSDAMRRRRPTTTGSSRMRELVQYIIFLLILTYLVLHNRSFYYYRMKDAVDRALLSSTFYSIGRVPDLWSFLRGPLLDFLFSSSTGAATFVLHNSILIGAPQVRQLRVPRTECRGVNKLFPNTQHRAKYANCFGEFDTVDNNDRAPFGPCGKNGLSASNCTTAWQYSEYTAAAGGGGGGQQLAAMFAGRFAFYPGGGYRFVLPLDSKQNASDLLTNLQASYWMDRATRAAFIDFSLLNVPTSIFCIVRLLAEFSAGGLAVTRSDFRVLKLLHGTRLSGVAGDTSWWNVPHAAQIVAWCFLLYYFYEELHELLHGDGVVRHLQDFWNLLDIVMLGFAAAWAVLCIYVDSFVLPRVVGDLKSLSSAQQHGAADYYVNLYDSAFHLEARGYAFAALNFVAWIKLFKYLSLNRATTTVFETLQEASGDLASYLILFSTVFLAMAQFGYICFGSDIDHYSSTLDAWLQLFQWIIGNYNYDELHAAHFLLGPMYFIAFVFIVYCVLLNLFLSIISEKYSATEQKVAQRSPDESYELYALVARTLRHWREWLAWHFGRRRRRQKSDPEPDVDFSAQRQVREPFSTRRRNKQKRTKKPDDDGVGKSEKNIRQSWEKQLKARGYTDDEIRAVFANGVEIRANSSSSDSNIRVVSANDNANALRSKIFSNNKHVASAGPDKPADKFLALVVPTASPQQLALYEKIQSSSQKLERLEYITAQMETYCKEILLKLQVYTKFERAHAV